ncbi:MAG: hypothetical protein EU541_07595 [Promethearchaeota archaeon]|nr:MAG: hypothetical protein EU541_07595 [Candidatus Lokiarchaeota archaeon]
MIDIIALLKFIGLLTTSSISAITIIYLVIYRKKYGIIFIPTFNVILITFIGIFFPTLFLLATEIYISYPINIILIKLTIIIEALSVFLYALDISILREYGEIQLSSFVYLVLIFSLILGTLIMPNSITIEIVDSEINYKFDNIITLLIFLHNISVIFYLCYNSIKIRCISGFKRLSNILLGFSFILSLSISLFCHYVLLELILFRTIFILLYWSSLLLKCFMILKKPQMYVKLTNEIYFIQIYHKSGVMLYSYNFKRNQKKEESGIWGNILIGLNHILSEFVKKDDQIDVLQTKEADIVVSYNNEYDFAIILKSLNKKNPYIETCINQLMEDFAEKYKNELEEIKDINKLINVVDFKDTKELIEKNFKIYL